MDATPCRLCGAVLPDDEPRCPNCGMHRAGDLGRAGYRRLIIGLAGVYGLTALLVFLIRGS
ncbi:MAG: hypothetical protein AB1679_34405 [Actinomycetota bacterium]|jgi:hypothetical protein